MDFKNDRVEISTNYENEQQPTKPGAIVAIEWQLPKTLHLPKG